MLRQNNCNIYSQKNYLIIGRQYLKTFWGVMLVFALGKPTSNQTHYLIGAGNSLTCAFIGVCCQDLSNVGQTTDFGYFEYVEWWSLI